MTICPFRLIIIVASLWTPPALLSADDGVGTKPSFDKGLWIHVFETEGSWRRRERTTLFAFTWAEMLTRISSMPRHFLPPARRRGCRGETVGSTWPAVSWAGCPKCAWITKIERHRSALIYPASSYWTCSITSRSRGRPLIMDAWEKRSPLLYPFPMSVFKGRG